MIVHGAATVHLDNSFKAELEFTRHQLQRVWAERREAAFPIVARPLVAMLQTVGLDVRRKRDLEYFESLLFTLPQMGGAAAGDYLEQQLLNHIFRNTAIFTPPANVYVGLYTAATDDTNAGGTEVSGGAYARKAVPTTGGWSDPGSTGGLTDNVAIIDFGIASASWGTISHLAIMSALTVGNRFFHGALAASKAVGSGDSFQFDVGALDISLA